MDSNYPDGANAQQYDDWCGVKSYEEEMLEADEDEDEDEEDCFDEDYD